MSEHSLRANMARIDISPRPEHMRAMGPAFDGADGLRKVAFPLHARLAVLDAENAAASDAFGTNSFRIAGAERMRLPLGDESFILTP